MQGITVERLLRAAPVPIFSARSSHTPFSDLEKSSSGDGSRGFRF
jgi:hypothetical protein